MLWSDAPATMPPPGEPVRAEEARAPQADGGPVAGVAGEAPDAPAGESDAVGPGQVPSHEDQTGPGEDGEEAEVAAGGAGLAEEEAEVEAGGPSVAGDEAFLAEMAAEFDAIQAALARLDDGTFDRCQVCGGRIGEERLMADPLVTRCAAHA